MVYLGYGSVLRECQYLDRFPSSGVLFSFFGLKGKLKSLFLELVNAYGNRVMLDSGAYSWWAKNVKSHEGRFGSYEWAKSKEFEEFFQSYVQFLKEYGIDNSRCMYVVLDVIGNAELSYDVWMRMKSLGFDRVMPVWHFGEDIAWLEKYMRSEAEWIGLGGKATNLDVEGTIRMWREVFSWMVNRFGKQKVLEKKIHLFAQTGFEVLKVVPYDSVDSTSFSKSSGMGIVLLPLRGERWTSVYISDRKEGKNEIFLSKSVGRKGLSGIVLKEVDMESFEKVCNVLFGEVVPVMEIERRLLVSTERGRWNAEVFLIVTEKIEKSISKEEKLDNFVGRKTFCLMV